MLGQALHQFHTPAFFPPMCYYAKYLTTREINPTYFFPQNLDLHCSHVGSWNQLEG